MCWVCEGQLHIQFVQYKNHYTYGMSPFRWISVCVCVCVREMYIFFQFYNTFLKFKTLNHHYKHLIALSHNLRKKQNIIINPTLQIVYSPNVLNFPPSS